MDPLNEEQPESAEHLLVDLPSHLSRLAPRSLRVTCYGSSSSRTPDRYTSEARRLGLLLASRGHTCVNGAGSSGCMAAMNDGADEGGGHIVGVIHEMFVVDGSDWLEGAHPVFHGEEDGSGSSVKRPPRKSGREILVASGNDLQERKRMLVEGADALVVLPGGPGTWDELWEMACSRAIGLTDLPIVCINVDGFYEPFRSILQRAHDEQLLHMPHNEIVHFESSAERAVIWVEEESARRRRKKEQEEAAPSGPRRRKNPKQMLGKEQSFLFSGNPWEWGRSASWVGGKIAGSEMNGASDTRERAGGWATALCWATTFVAGVAMGAALATARSSRV